MGLEEEVGGRNGVIEGCKSFVDEHGGRKERDNRYRMEE